MTRPVAVRGGHFTVAGHQLAYELYGDSGNPCVLVHGILLDSLLNRDLAVRFAASGYQVALLDLLGHGRSARPHDPKEHRVDFYADQLLALMDHLGWERALIGGISLGAMTSITAAAKAPQRVAGLFLEMPVMEWSAPWAAVILAPMLVATRYGGLLYRRFARLMARLPRPRTAWMASGMNAFSTDPRVVAAILHGVLVGPMVPPVEMDSSSGCAWTASSRNWSGSVTGTRNASGYTRICLTAGYRPLRVACGCSTSRQA